MLWAAVFIATFFAYYAVSSETVINTVFAELALLLPVSLGCFALAVRCLYAPICVVLEQRRPVEAIKRSWALTRGTFWLTFGRLFLISFITSFIAGMINQVLDLVHRLGRRLGRHPDAVVCADRPDHLGLSDSHVRRREDPQRKLRHHSDPGKPGVGGGYHVCVRCSSDT